MTGIVLDSNLLLLLVVGLAGEDYIPKHKRLNAYTVDDFRLLAKEISVFERIIVTPNTLTETSNLLGYIAEPDRSDLFTAFRGFMQSADESYYKSEVSSRHPEFERLGLTDSVLLEALSSDNPLLTSDLDLYLAASARSPRVMNFNHIRDRTLNP